MFTFRGKAKYARWPAAAVAAGAGTATINGITYTFTNQGCNALNSAYIFDDDPSTHTYFDGLGGYNATTGVYAGSATATNTRTGAWFQMQTSVPILVRGYELTQMLDGYVIGWYIFGSNNGTSWTELTSVTMGSWPYSNVKQTYSFANSTSYTYHRVVISLAQTTTAPHIAEFKFIT